MKPIARKSNLVIWTLLLAFLPVTAPGAQPAKFPKIIGMESSAPLLHIKIMVPAGSAWDSPGLEGSAEVTGRMILEGGFGSRENPTTKEKLAEITRPWGEGAYPRISVSKETTTFSMTVPRERLATFSERVLGPMLTQPLFATEELGRIKAEISESLRSDLRLEQIELLGLVTLDNFIHEGTAYAHPDMGTEKGLEKITVGTVRRFYDTNYRPEKIVVGVSTSEEEILAQIRAAFDFTGPSEIAPIFPRPIESPARVKGHEALIVALPNAISTGLHAGFPIPLTRKDKDYWPLYVANIWLGTHRDNFSHLYQVIRDQRGYNYGDYSYIEHFEGRPFYLFPPPNSPRRHQYFSIWIRPVQHEYAYHLMKAMAWELEHFIRVGLTQDQCSAARNKAKVLYLNLAETTHRLLAYRLDDEFYGLTPGYLQNYLENVKDVSCGEMNAAIRKYLQSENLKYVIVTDDEVAPKLAEEIAAGRPAWGKSPADYQIDVQEENGQKVYKVPENKLELLRRDAAWAHYWLDIPKVRIVAAEKLFATAALPTD